MERSKSKHGPVTKFQDKFYHDYPSYRKEERRDGRAKTRRSDSGRSRNRETSRPREKSIDRRPGARPAARSGSVKRFSSQPPERSGRSDVSNWSTQARGQWSRGQTEDNEWRAGPGPGHPQVQDRRRWGWVGGDFEMVSNNNNNNNNMSRSNNNNHSSIKSRHIANDYVDISSMETSSTASDGSSMMTFTRPRLRRSHDRDTDMSRSGSGYNKIYSRHPGPVSRSRSISRPSPPRAKSVGYSSSSGHPARTHSFTSIYETRSMGTGYGGHRKGTSLDLRPLRTSLSSQGILFTETGHLPKQPSYEPDMGPVSISLQDLQSSGFRKSTDTGRSLLDLCNVTINDSEIDKDDALLIVSIAKRAVEVSGDMRRPGVHGKVAGLIKDKVEQGLGLGGWQCIVGQKGTFGCCLAPAPNNYFNFDLPTVTVLMFKAT